MKILSIQILNDSQISEDESSDDDLAYLETNDEMGDEMTMTMISGTIKSSNSLHL